MCHYMYIFLLFEYDTLIVLIVNQGHLNNDISCDILQLSGGTLIRESENYGYLEKPYSAMPRTA